MNNIIKIWVITIITVFTALLLPSIVYAAEKNPIEDTKEWIKYTDGENEVYKERYVFYEGTDERFEYTTALFHTNDYTGTGRGAYVFYVVRYCNVEEDNIILQTNSNGSPQKVKCPYKHGGNFFFTVYEDDYVISSSADFYYDFEDEEFDPDGFFDDILSGVIPVGTVKLKDTLVFDPIIGDWVSDDVKYDLEIVKGVTINISDNIKDEYIIKWKPSEELQNKDYYRNVEVEIYQILNGQCKDKIWDSWQEFYFKPYLYDTPYAYKELWQGNMEGTDLSKQLVSEFLNDDDGFIANYNKSDFALRYRYVDDDNVLHYSTDYVYIQCTKDGTYTVSVPDTDDVEDITPNVPTIKVEDYTDEVIEEDTEDIEVTNIFSTIKSLFNTLKDFPTYFGKIFNMFPAWLITLMSFGIGALIIIGIMKAVL